MRVTKHKTKIQVLLTVLVVLSVVRQFFLGNYHNMFLGMLTLLLFMVPQFVDKKLGVTIPIGLETAIMKDRISPLLIILYVLNSPIVSSDSCKNAYGASQRPVLRSKTAEMRS